MNMSDEYDMTENTQEGDAQWVGLDPSEKKELLKNVFSDENWYDGIPFFEGGQEHPPFDEIAQRVGTDQTNIKKYYVAWCKARGFDVETIKESMTSAIDPLASVTVSQPAPVKEPEVNTAYQQEMNRMQSEAFTAPARANPVATLQAPKGGSDSDSMFSMMQFLVAQQQMQSDAQHRQMMMQMEQRRIEQQRETEIRREAQARDQQFMMQNMAFMREMMRTKDNDGFFDSDMKTIFKQRMVEQMLDGGANSGALERIASRLLQPEMLGTLASAASNVMPTRNQVPAGYDSPTYDPYAQPSRPVQPQPQPQAAPVVQNPPPTGDGNFFEGPEVEQENEEVDADISPEQYKSALLSQFQQIMGQELEDPKTLSAVQQQIDITVDNVVVEYSQFAPQGKLDKMAERMVLVRSLRDIGRGMQDAMDKINEGTDPDLVYSFVVGELKKNEVFWNIFSGNSYDELMALIEPYKNTGGVIHDYNFLLRPDVANVCREILRRVQDA
jgi:hypothetical protein